MNVSFIALCIIGASAQFWNGVLALENKDDHGHSSNSNAKAVPGFVAFSVKLTTNYGPIAEDAAVPFDTIITNIGDGYDMATDAFVAPVAGVYYFSFSLRGEAIVAILKRNGLSQVAIASNLYAHYQPTTSQSAVLSLSEGDRVEVELLDDIDGDYDVIISNGAGYCSFSGFLLHQTV